MKKYKEHIKKHWYCFLLAPIFMTLEAAGEFILPFINANIIDQGAASGDIPYILENGFYMLLIAAAMLAFGVLGAFLQSGDPPGWRRAFAGTPLLGSRPSPFQISIAFPPVL